MSDPHPARASLEKEDKRTFLQKIAEFIHPGPDSKAELIETLADAEDNDIIGTESRVMLEGVIRMAELTAGVMTDATIPANMRWIPKGMTVEYLKKAVGTLRGVATPDIPVVVADAGYDLPVSVVVTDVAGETVFRARIAMWVSPKAPR